VDLCGVRLQVDLCGVHLQVDLCGVHLQVDRVDPMKVLIVGYGKMGKLVEEVALARGHEIAGIVDVGRSEFVPADVAIDFSTADALRGNFGMYLERRLPVVIGTTGWQAHADSYRSRAAQAGLGVVAAPNFSIGVNIFELVVAEAARLMAQRPEYDAYLHERHHAAKLDAPSGTAIMLREAMMAAGFNRPVNESVVRAGKIPGIHTIGFDSASDTIELTHTARDRRGFASGAVAAAEWLQGRTGWFSMQDVLRRDL
jgi:4-hydroxy-tetrahydrodipicolinate reductase